MEGRRKSRGHWVNMQFRSRLFTPIPACLLNVPYYDSLVSGIPIESLTDACVQINHDIHRRDRQQHIGMSSPDKRAFLRLAPFNYTPSKYHLPLCDIALPMLRHILVFYEVAMKLDKKKPLQYAELWEFSERKIILLMKTNTHINIKSDLLSNQHLTRLTHKYIMHPFLYFLLLLLTISQHGINQVYLIFTSSWDLVTWCNCHINRNQIYPQLITK